MALKQLKCVVKGGSGGPLNNAVPVYSDQNAPTGGQTYDKDGKSQLKLPNGTELITVDYLACPSNLIKEFFNFKENGVINYRRVWLVAADGVTGLDFEAATPVSGGKPVMQPMFIENDKCLFGVDPDEPPPPVGKPGYTITGTFSMHITPD